MAGAPQSRACHRASPGPEASVYKQGRRRIPASCAWWEGEVQQRLSGLAQPLAEVGTPDSDRLLGSGPSSATY